jgi:hypothetical protein
MATHYHVPPEQLESHPSMVHLRKPSALTIYGAAYQFSREFLCSTSSWGTRHIEALKVLDFNDQPVERLCPTQFLVTRDSALGKQIIEHFSLSTVDVKAGRYNIMAATNSFYDELATLLCTSAKTPSPPSYHSRPRRVVPSATIHSPPQYDPDTILGTSFQSSSSGESYIPGKSPPRRNNIEEPDHLLEITTNNLIISFLSLLSNFAYPERNPTKARPRFNLSPDSIKFSLYGTTLSSWNDGSGWKTRFSQTGGQWVGTGGAPLITIEVQIVWTGTDG